MNNNYESHAISRRSFLKASGVVGAAGILAACGLCSPRGRHLGQQPPRRFLWCYQRSQHHRRYPAEGVHLLGEHQP